MTMFILKIMSRTNKGFDIRPVHNVEKFTVVPQTENKPPYVEIKNYGDQRTYHPAGPGGSWTETILPPNCVEITGDLYILNEDGNVITTAIYSDLVKEASLSKHTHHPQLPISGGAIQGAEPQTFSNMAGIVYENENVASEISPLSVSNQYGQNIVSIMDHFHTKFPEIPITYQECLLGKFGGHKTIRGYVVVGDGVKAVVEATGDKSHYSDLLMAWQDEALEEAGLVRKYSEQHQREIVLIKRDIRTISYNMTKTGEFWTVRKEKPTPFKEILKDFPPTFVDGFKHMLGLLESHSDKGLSVIVSDPLTIQQNGWLALAFYTENNHWHCIGAVDIYNKSFTVDDVGESSMSTSIPMGKDRIGYIEPCNVYQVEYTQKEILCYKR